MTDRRAQFRFVSVIASSLIVSIVAPVVASATETVPGRVVDWQVIAGQDGRLPRADALPRAITVAEPVRPGREAARAEESGLASWYGYELAGEPTASGERFDPEAMTAAHKTLPLGAIARVTHAETGKSVVVRINDRGPFVDGRIVDLSQAAARALGMETRGVAPVRVAVLGADPTGRAGALLTAEAPPPPAVPTAPPSAARPVAARAEPFGQMAAQGRALFVQAASFRDPGRAAAAADRLADAGRTAIQVATVHGRTVHRVVVGPWPSGDSAQSARARIEAAGFPGALVVERR